MTGLWAEYQRKKVPADKAVGVVRSGDWVAYSHFVMFPETLDAALARRVGELSGVKVKVSTGMQTPAIVAADPQQRSFLYHSSFFSHSDRQLGDRQLAYHIPGNFYEEVSFLQNGHTDRPRVALLKTTAMDDNGFFNFGTSCTFTHATATAAEKVIVEVNTHVPRCLGGYHEHIHLSQVDFVVEGENRPMPTLPDIQASEPDGRIAAHIMTELEDGCCLQLGIGGIPNAVGRLIADSDLRDLGFHSEMMVDALLDLYEKRRVTGTRKQIDPLKNVYTFAMGSERLYRFLDENPACAIFPVDYTNGSDIVARNTKVVSVNKALQVDLYGQVCSESMGHRQISGTGGQLDFVIGATRSPGGKAFICLHATRQRQGQRVSNIVPNVAGIVTVPRSMAFYVVTEYGKVNLKGKTTWQRAEALISIAHPDFRDDLVREAEKMGIWSVANQKS